MNLADFLHANTYSGKVKVTLTSVKIKITCSESIKHFPKTKSKVYFTKITT